MSGLTEEQWDEVKKRLDKIDKMHDKLLILETKLGIKNGNGLIGRIKKLEERPGKYMKWIPVGICIIMLFANIYGWVDSSIRQNIQIRQMTTSVSPAPTP
jgi:hypothetical protein